MGEDGEYKVLLRTVGKFVRVTRKGRTYNVHGKLVDVADRETVIFKPGSQLMSRLLGEEWDAGVDNEDE
jgi:nucleoid DNA-binding protein